MRAALTIALLLAAVPALADPVRVNVAIQPWRYVRELCGQDQPWGCVTFLPAVDNPRDVRCTVHIANDAAPWEWAITEARLRRQCEG